MTNILIYPNKKLITICSKYITQNNIDEVSADLVEMKHLAQARGALGIAANQMGFNIRAIIVRIKQTYVTMLNPRIIDSTGSARSMEGCLSFPGVMASITRADKIEVEWEDATLTTHKQKFENLESTIIQHEIDHLDGITIYQRARKTTRALITKTLKKHNKMYQRSLQAKQKTGALLQRMAALDEKNKVLIDAKKNS